eukprot:GILI01001520.1.p1 GENE.GILI01001520.1~~GILI01001520.1.p1  ORF type:complete len:290 (+),score=90.80 GILI01001520.1:88-870(+)
MFRNLYDTDVITFSPQGRIFQVEYAMEAVKQGSAAVGLRSNSHVVLVTLRRAAGDLAEYQRKIFKIDEHIGIAISGLLADGRLLSKYMRNECLNHKFVYDSPLPVSRLVTSIGDKSQARTQSSSGRPYGVGLLVAGADSTGPHLWETCPSGNIYEYKAMAIGARSQPAKTYLEKHFETFTDCSVDELIKHGLRALQNTCQTDDELSAKNVSVAVVGKEEAFKIIEGDALLPYVSAIKDADMQTESMAEEPAADAPNPMES